MTALPNTVVVNRRRLLAAVPPFRPVAVQLLKLLDAPDQDLASVVDLLRSDAVIAADLVRAANSPLFGCRYEIRNPLQALAYLGLERIKALVTTTAIRALVNASVSRLSYSCWRHNLATALICQKLSAPMNLPAERCYVGGLIHDIGRLALLAAHRDYERLSTVPAATSQEFLAAERRLFGFDHGEAGGWLLAQWGCPIEMQNVAAFHENPAAAPNCDRAIVSLVHTGSQLADWMGMSVFPSARRGQLREIAGGLAALANNGISVDCEELAEWVVTRVNGIELSLA